MIHIYIGRDPRQPLSFNVCANSIIEHASVPVAIHPLVLSALPINRQGLTEFTFSRFLVPHLEAYADQLAVFMDPDIVVRGDIAELVKHCEQAERAAVYVNKEQPQFEWPSVMVFDPARCWKLTPEWIDNDSNSPFNLESWAESIGSFPKEWNYCVGYSDPTEAADAKLLHFTEGVPCWAETMGYPEDQTWHIAKMEMLHTVDWRDLMGGSIHATKTLQRFLKLRGYGNANQ